MVPRLVLGGLIVLCVLFGAAQFVPVQRTNPPVPAPLRAPVEIQSIIDRCCIDCHTNETRWPWYAHVAPMSWLVARDVKVGRDNLDFSYWGQLPADEQRHLAKKIIREVTAREMPIRVYLFMHPKARPTDADIQLLKDWFSSPEATPGPSGDSPAPSRHSQDSDEED